MTVAWSLQAGITLLASRSPGGCGVPPKADPVIRASLSGLLALVAAPWVHAYDMIPLSVAVAVLAPSASREARVLVGFPSWPGAITMVPIPTVLTVASIVGVAWLAWKRVWGDVDVASNVLA